MFTKDKRCIEWLHGAVACAITFIAVFFSYLTRSGTITGSSSGVGLLILIALTVSQSKHQFLSPVFAAPALLLYPVIAICTGGPLQIEMWVPILASFFMTLWISYTMLKNIHTTHSLLRKVMASTLSGLLTLRLSYLANGAFDLYCFDRDVLLIITLMAALSVPLALRMEEPLTKFLSPLSAKLKGGGQL
jgi:hypothetical protein